MNWWALKHKLHMSWLITIMCLAMFIGVVLSQYFSDFYQPPLLAVLFIGVSLWRKYIYLIPLLIIGGLLMGLWRGSIDRYDLRYYDDLYNKKVQIAGIAIDDIKPGASNRFIIELHGIIINQQKLSGNVWATVSDSDINQGDRVTINGKLLRGFGNYIGVMYKADVIDVIKTESDDYIKNIRNFFIESVNKSVPSLESSLGLGFLVGRNDNLSADFNSALQAAGLTHIVVASGYNLTILVRIARRLFAKISKYLSALVSFLMIFSFIAITGLSPSMMRAGLVSGLCLLAWYYGRKFHPIVLLSIAIAITVAMNPSYAWGDLGWQLSFLAFAGVMILAPLLQRFLFGVDKANFVGQILIETVSAQILTAPIIIYSFGQFSNIAIISNLLILPLIPMAMLLTFAAGIGGSILPSFALVIGLPASLLLGYMINVVNYSADTYWSVMNIKIDLITVFVCYLVIFIICLFLWRKTGYNLRDASLVD